MNIPLIIIGISVFFIFLIVIRKFPTLASIDTHSIPQEQFNQKKKDLYADRLQRKIKERTKKIKPLFIPLIQMLRSSFYFSIKKVRELGTSYRLKRSQGHLPDSPNPTERDVLVEAEDLFYNDKLKQAEEAYIALIEHNSKNIDAYEGLAEVYLAQKDFVHAEETLTYVVKLKDMIVKENESDTPTSNQHDDTMSDLALHHFELGEVHERSGSFSKALRSYKEAVKNNSRNPKYLDALIRVSIHEGNILLAHKTLTSLREVNPDNIKISEWEERLSSEIDA